MVSLILFLICGEGFTTFFNNYLSKKLLSGFQIDWHYPVISHLLFVGITPLFIVTDRDSEALHWILEAYEIALGQKVN